MLSTGLRSIFDRSKVNSVRRISERPIAHPSVATTSCMQRYMKNGSPAVIVSGGKVYQLKGDTTAAEPVLDCAWTVQDIAENTNTKEAS
jgi:hypothetical protein